jgi:hypothetical protein
MQTVTRRFSVIGGIVAAALLAGAPSASAGFASITVNDNFFNPDRATLPHGPECFQWDWGTPNNPHNVRQDRKLFYSGAPTASDSAFFGRCASAGSFHYYCEVHGFASGGMDGRLRVRPTSPKSTSDDRFRVTWALDNSNTGNRFDVRFRVGNGDWRDWRKDTERLSGLFGRNNTPVDVRPNRTYFFKARSQKGPNDNRVSGWSPRLRVET